MAHVLSDRVKETTTTTGTGNLALGGAVANFRDFDTLMANADTTNYAIVHRTANEWEVGRGTWNTGNTLSRTVVYAGTNGTSAVNLSAGTKDVFMTLNLAGSWPGINLESQAAIDWGGVSVAVDASGDLQVTTDAADGVFVNSGAIVLTIGGNVRFIVNSTSALIDRPLSVNGNPVSGVEGDASNPALWFNSGTLTTTPPAGAIEKDSTNFYGTTDAGNRGYIPVRHFVRTAAGRTLTNTTNEQAIFDAAIDTITLETGVYKFESILRFSAMSGTSGNARIDWPGAGTATIDTWMWWYNAADNSNIGPGPLTVQGGWPAQAGSAANIATAGTGTALGVAAWGTFDVTTGGTFIPTIDLTTGAAASVNPGSYFMCERIGASDVESVGQWT